VATASATSLTANVFNSLRDIITIIKTSSVGDASSIGGGLAGWPVTVGVVEVGVVYTRYGVSQPGADAAR